MDFVKSPEYVLKMLLQQRKSFSISTSRKVLHCSRTGRLKIFQRASFSETKE